MALSGRRADARLTPLAHQRCVIVYDHHARSTYAPFLAAVVGYTATGNELEAPAVRPVFFYVPIAISAGEFERTRPSRDGTGCGARGRQGKHVRATDRLVSKLPPAVSRSRALALPSS
jgi:hypothetical protein